MVNVPGLPPDFWTLLVAAAGDGRVALVGGAVRDLLLHQQHRDPWRGLVDVDLVIEAPLDSRVEEGGLWLDNRSPAMQLAERLAEASREIAIRSVRPHGRYGTVELDLEFQPAQGGSLRLLVDVATARREYYPISGENPSVCLGGLEDDLARRDFTVNAMAVDLTTGTILDPHGGQHDLAQRCLRFLHPRSLRDDPTRLVRAARYAARLGFCLAPESRLQAMSTLSQWPWTWRPGDPPGAAPAALGSRLRMELDLLLERGNWRVALAHLQEWGGLELLDAGLQADRGWRLRLARAIRFGVPLAASLVAVCSDPIALAERLQLPQRQLRLLVQHGELKRRLAAAGFAAGHWQPSRWCELLEQPGLSPQAIALSLGRGGAPPPPRGGWWHHWRHVPSPVSAAELLAQGISKGPELGALMRQARFERLDLECA